MINNMSLKDKIENTPTFKKMDGVQKSIYGTPAIKKQVEFALTMIGLKGFVFWVKNTSPSSMLKGIVEDLINNQKAI